MNTKHKAILPAAAAVVTALLLLSLGLLKLNTTQTTPQNAVGSAPGLAVSALCEEVKSTALEGLTVVKKVYRLSEDLLVGPRPAEAGWFSTDDPAEVTAILQEAEELLAGREPIFREDLPFIAERGISGYRDDSILALVWHEYDLRHQIVTYAEVFLGDSSQLRRKISGDTYGNNVRKFPGEMAAECNAVLAVSGDFYQFRSQGIHMYQRELYRCSGTRMDTCWFDSSGNMLFTRAGEIYEEEKARAFAEENDILFTLTFGPVMVENGVNACPEYYSVGEFADHYPRAAIAQDGELHYLMMVDSGGVSVSEAADMLVAKGVDRAYALDGGQTGAIVLGGETLNHNMYGSQRPLSDIVWFATAVPEGGVG